jgi:hypothetical protein
MSPRDEGRIWSRGVIDTDCGRWTWVGVINNQENLALRDIEEVEFYNRDNFCW